MVNQEVGPLDLPIDWGLIVGFQILISLGKGAAAKETIVGGEGRGVRRLEDEVFGGVNKGTLSLGV